MKRSTDQNDHEENIITSEYSEEMQRSYINYAMSVIIARAIPDVRDGLKPVQRRTLYDMHQLGIRYDRPYRKSARIVGDTMGKYHPHGDSSIFDSLVVMSQDFKNGLPRVDGHGNFGSIEGDPPAAMRYTEARLQKITQEYFLADLDKDVVDFMPNFDETEKEPAVLPVRIPNILVNGSEGIAVGMTTSIPTHNLGEVIDGVKALIANEDLTDKELMKYIKGPDFPTGGIIINQDELAEIYRTGQGKIKLRGRVEYEKGKGGREYHVITEIPYTMIGANIGKFLNDVYSLVESKTTTDITDISNQSSKEGIRIVLELKKNADVENLKNLLYRKTKLQDTFAVNMLTVCDGKPQVLSLKGILENYLDFQYELTTRKYRNMLNKELDRKEIQEGLIKACDVIDLIIEILRGSKSRQQAKDCLVLGETKGIKFKSKDSKDMASLLHFTERQADAILDMRLYKLIGLEIEALQKEHDQTLKDIAEYRDILENFDSMNRVILKDLEKIKKEFAVPRKTSIENAEEAVFVEKPEEAVPVRILIDRFGYIRSIDDAAYERNKEAADSESRFCFPSLSTGRTCIFSDAGNMYVIRNQYIPFGRFR
ncbi:MAG: DNA topoisomerase, partial [Lachnospiraceae bacterium]|nr:DNA topoisomerase [Lachnospiraceae bacterium]